MVIINPTFLKNRTIYRKGIKVLFTRFDCIYDEYKPNAWHKSDCFVSVCACGEGISMVM